MTRSNWAHLEDLAPNEFHAFVRQQNAGGGHPITILSREKSSSDFSAHIETSTIRQKPFR